MVVKNQEGVKSTTGLLPDQINENFHYWKMRRSYRNSIAVSIARDGIMLVRYNQPGDWFHFYAFTCEGKPLQIGWIDGGTQFDPTIAPLLIDVGQALIELASAKHQGRLQEALSLLGFTTIYEGWNR